MSSLVSNLWAGAGLGLSVAAPIGPTSMLCVQRTLSRGLSAGLTTGLGVATVHLSYGALVIWSTEFASASPDMALRSLLSGAVLLFLSIRVLRSAAVIGADTKQRHNLGLTYVSAVGFSLLNPITPVLFMAAMPSVVGRFTALSSGLAAGVFLGSFAWWVSLNSAVYFLRGRLTVGCLSLMNKVAGLALAALALRMMANVLL